MTLRHGYFLGAAPLAALLFIIAGAGWKEPPRGAAVLPAPLLSGLDPSAAAAGSPGFTLTVTGAFFTAHTVVHWNGAGRETVVVNRAVARAWIPASDVASEGSAGVTVVNPVPGEHSGASNTLPFRILPASSF